MLIPPCQIEHSSCLDARCSQLQKILRFMSERGIEERVRDAAFSED